MKFRYVLNDKNINIRKMTRQTFHIISTESAALREQWFKPVKRSPLIDSSMKLIFLEVSKMQKQDTSDRCQFTAWPFVHLMLPGPRPAKTLLVASIRI